jgi:hypothetical protein
MHDGMQRAERVVVGLILGAACLCVGWITVSLFMMGPAALVR